MRKKNIRSVDRSLDQEKRLTGKVPELLDADRGYRGQKQSEDTQVVIPGVPLRQDNRYKRGTGNGNCFVGRKA
jgi:IS5 family transposase